jgi:Cytochrome C oxidase, cbb3-type, subunit III
MIVNLFRRQKGWAIGGAATVVGVSLLWATVAARDSRASWPWQCASSAGCQRGCQPYFVGDGIPPGELGGTWYWLRTSEEEKQVTTALFNRYCIRCHGVDGRGVWDIPGVPNFTNTVWQTSRTDPQLARIILEGRGAIMPSFRGALTLEEAWAMARHLRTFAPGAETTGPNTPRSSNLPSSTFQIPRETELPQPRMAPGIWSGSEQ